MRYSMSFTLNDISRVHFVVYCIHNDLFIRAPKRRNEEFLRRVARQTMDDDMLGNRLDTLEEDVHIFLQGQRFEFARAVIGAQIGVFQNVKKLKLNPVGTAIDGEFDRIEHILPRFVG